MTEVPRRIVTRTRPHNTHTPVWNHLETLK